METTPRIATRAAARRRIPGVVGAIALLVATAHPAAAATSVPPGFADEIYSGVFDYPTAFAFIPDGRVLVTEQDSGTIWLVLTNRMVAVDAPYTIPDVRNDYVERGVLSIAVDPRWPAQPYVYVHYTSTAGHIRLMRYTASGDLMTGTSSNLTLGSPYEVLDAPDQQPQHNGGSLRFGPDGKLYFSLGEDFTWCEAQDSTSLLGRILRLDVTRLPAGAGGPPPLASLVPADNPYVAYADTAMQLTFAMGLRNPFRFQIDAATGLLYVADVGDASWEELDEVGPRFNGGWPFREGPAPYGAPPSCGSAGSGYDEPIQAYDHDTGLVILSAGVLRRKPGSPWPPHWEGNAFYADYASKFLRMMWHQDGTWVPATFPGQPDPDDFASNLSSPVDFAWGPDGNLWWLSREDSTYMHRTGALHRIYPTMVLAADPPVAEPVALAAGPNPSTGPVTLRFSMPAGGAVRLDVFDVTGRRVARVVDQTLPAGTHVMRWDGRDDAGEPVPAGVYLARLVTPVTTASARVVRIR
jgi:glucose/arabinose dehydrogenase